MEPNTKQVLQFAGLQSIAEAYLDGVDLETRASNVDLIDRLRNGNNHYAFDPANGNGKTKLTDQQIDWFFENFDIVDHYANDPSGFSATVFRNKSSGQYTISFRSVEYADESKGGDWLRDGRSGGAGEISGRGVALAQVASMERYLENLRAGQRYEASTGRWVAEPKLFGLSAALATGSSVNITGYSLGGHLANVFTLLHRDLVNHTYVFNASGLGVLDGLTPTASGYADLLRHKLAIYRAVVFGTDENRNRMALTGEVIPGVTLTGPERELLSRAITDNLVRPPDPTRTYTNTIHAWALEFLASGTVGSGAGRFTALFDGLENRGLALNQLSDKVTSYLASRDEFGNPVPDAFDTGLYEFADDKITSLYGKGVFFDPEFVANTGYHPKATALYVEDQPLFREEAGLLGFAGDFGETHSITLLIDSLTVLDLLQNLDPSLTIESYRALESSIANSVHAVSYKNVVGAISNASVMALALRTAIGSVTGILDANSNLDKLKDADALEATVRAVGDLLEVDLSAFDLTPQLTGGGFGDLAKRNQLHDAIAAIRSSAAFAALAGSSEIVPLVGTSVEDILSGAMKSDATGLAYRFALDRLNPFVVLTGTELYDGHNLKGELDRGDAGSGMGRMTDAYLADRAAFLHWKAKLDSFNKVAAPYAGTVDVSYKDFATGSAVDLVATGVGPSVNHRFIHFAGPQGSAVLGGVSDDRLYGNVGSDRIDAGRGDDYIEGGDRADKLFGGAGRDVVLGGRGDDEIGGGADPDVLEGGMGIDTYVINTGDGADTIRDIGPSFIRWNGQVLAGAFEKGADGVYRFLSSDLGPRGLTLTFSSPATISDGTGTSLTLADYDSPEDFATRDFGFALVDESKPQPTVRRFLGTDGDDTIWTSSPDNDEIVAGAGSDYVVAFGGDDYVNGGSGSDYLVGDGDGAFGRDTLIGGVGVDFLAGERGADRLFGDSETSLPDALATSAGAGVDARGDWLNGGEGDDVIVGSSAHDVLLGGSGADVLAGGVGNDYLLGDADYAYDDSYGFEWSFLGDPNGWTSYGNPAAIAVAGGDSLYGGAGNDWIHAGRGDDDLFGDEGEDLLIGDLGADVLVGGAGADVLWAGLAGRGDYTDLGDDVLDGGDGDDQLYGSGGRNSLFGGAGADRIYTGPAADFVDAGDGDDQISGLGADTVFAGEGNDAFSAFDTVGVIAYGEGGNDVLTGWSGADELFGGDGHDALVGLEGVDFLDGGSGNDRYLFRTDDGIDQVVDPDGADVAVLISHEHTSRLEDRIERSSIRLLSAEGEVYLAYGDVGDRIGLGTDPRGVVETIELRHVFGATQTVEIIDFAELWAAYSPGPAPSNTAPVFAGPLADVVANEDEPFVLTLPGGAFVDPDGDPLEFAASLAGGAPLPAWLSFDPATTRFSCTPGNAEVGEYEIEVVATDPESASVSAGFSIRVANVNDAPSVTGTIDPRTVAEDSVLSFVVPAGLFADPDAGDGLSLSAALVGGATLPAWLAFDAVLGAFGGTPSNEDVGTIELIVTAADSDGANASTAFLLSVTNTNDAPVATGTIAPQSVEEESFFDYVLLAGLFADVDVGDLLSLSASLAGGDPLPAWLTFDATAGRLSGAPTRADVGDWEIRITGADAAAAQANLTFDLSVTKVPGRALGGTTGSDTVLGGSGDDVISAGPGADALIGGKGDDTFVLAPGDGTWSAGYAAYNAGSPGNPGTGRIVGISGRTRLFDTMDGGDGVDVVKGTASADAVFLDDLLSPFPAAAGPRLTGIERFLMGGGNDVVDLTSFDFSYGPVRLEGESGDDLLWASAGDDALFGGAGRDDLYGGAGDDALFGGDGNDLVDAAAGVDIAQGEQGDDTLAHAAGPALLDSGAGNDTIIGGGGTELIAGGAGNDVLRPGAGSNVVLHNRGEGIDLLFPAIGARNILSLGGGIGYEDLALSRSGNDLLLHTSLADRVTLVDWYGAEANRTLETLQVIAAAMAGFDTDSTDPIRDDAIEWFEFANLVADFDAARAADATIARWQMIDAFVAADLGGSDDLAVGGALAYRYGITGGFSGVDSAAAQAILRSSGAGAGPQSVTAALDGAPAGAKLS